MARIGTPQGVFSDTKFLLDFKHNTALDLSTFDNTVTKAGIPKYNDGFLGRGVTFDGNSANYLTVADSASINIATSLTVDFALRVNSLAASAIFLDRDGTLAAWRVSVSSSTNKITFAVRNGAGTSGVVSSNRVISLKRWYHVRCVFDVTGFFYMFINGQLDQKDSTVLTDLSNSGLGSLWIGRNGTVAGDTVLPLDGALSDISIRSVADTSEDTLLPNIKNTDVVTRSTFMSVDIDLRNQLHTTSWTDDTLGAFEIASFALSPLVLDVEDVVSMRGKDEGSAAVALTKVGNITDVRAASNVFFYDVVTGKLHIGDNPTTTYSEYLEVIVVLRVADRYQIRDGRYYFPILLQYEIGKLSTPFTFAGYPTGDGGNMIIARSPKLPDDIFAESSNIIWTRSAVRLERLAEHLTEKLRLFTGIVDEQPKAHTEKLEIPVVAEYGKFHKANFDTQILTKDDFPNLGSKWDGEELPQIWGIEHKQVPCAIVDTNPSGTLRTAKVAPHKIAQLSDAVWKNDPFTSLPMENIDLEAATFQVSVLDDDASGGDSHPLEPEILVNVAGYGTPSDPSDAGPLTTFGSADDALKIPKDMLQEWLLLFGGVSAAQLADPSWADTSSRVGRPLRFVDQMSAPGAFVNQVSKLLNQTATFLYQLRNGDFGWKDVDEESDADFVLIDQDIISETWEHKRDLLTKKVVASAWEYVYDEDSQLYSVGAGTELELVSSTKYELTTSRDVPPTKQTLLYDKSSVADWLLRFVQNLFEQVITFHHVRVSNKFSQIQLMHVVSNQTSSLPTNLGTRWRVIKLENSGDFISLVLFPEALFTEVGEGGGGGGGDTDPDDIFRPRVAPSFHASTGRSIVSAITSTTFIPIRDHRELFQGGFPFPTGTTQRLAAYAQRVGGSSDIHAQIRIRDITNSTTLATINVGTTLGEHFSTTFTGIPSSDAVIEIQGKVASGATLNVYSVSWESEEPEEIAFTVPSSPTNYYSFGKTAGVTCTPTAIGGTDMWLVPGWRSSSLHSGFISPRGRCVLQVDGTGTTSFNVYLSRLRSGWSALPIFEWIGITSSGIFEGTFVSLPPEEVGALGLTYKLGGAVNGTIYAVNWTKLLE